MAFLGGIVEYWGYAVYLFLLLVILGTGKLLGKATPQYSRRSLVYVYSSLGIFLFIIIFPTLKSVLISTPNIDYFLPELQNICSFLSASLLFNCMFGRHGPESLFLQITVPAIATILFLIPVLILMEGGIINFVWFILFSGTLSLYLLVTELYGDLSGVISGVETSRDSALQREVLQDTRSEFNGLMKMSAQGFLALGASVGVSMSILFKGGPAAWNESSFQVNALRMVIGYSIIGAGLLLWVVRPYLNSFVGLRRHYAAAISKDGRKARSGRKKRTNQVRR